jgi:outer membrane autotransporter protein
MAGGQPLTEGSADVLLKQGETRNVSLSNNLSCDVVQNSILNINDASVGWIRAELGLVNLIDGVIDISSNPAFGNAAAIELKGSKITASGAHIVNSNGAGVLVQGLGVGQVAVGSEAIIANSFISGVGMAMLVGQSTVSLTGTEVIGSQSNKREAVGIDTNTSRIEIDNGSLIRGDDTGVRIQSASSVPGAGMYPNVPTIIGLDHSVIQGVTGPAIKLVGARGQGALARITVKNDAVLLSGNGNLIEVYDESALNLTVDDSRLTGNMLAENGSTLDIEMRNGARLTGNVLNGNVMNIKAGAQWQLIGDSDVKQLSLERGRISFAGDGFHSLSMNELSGNGTFDMRINLDTAQGDLLNVTGQATGHHQLNVQNTGIEAVKPEFEPLRIVHTEGGDAQFGLIGGRVDLGAYSYLLEKQDNDWFIVGEGKVISPSTQSALALFNAAPAIWNSELTTLRSRMGEVRGQEEGGGWIRSYGNRFNAGTGAGMHYQQKQQGLSFGADAPIPVSNGSLVIGVMGGYSKSDLDLSRGTSGEVNSYYAGVYGTWLLDDGYYFDGVLKLNSFHNESEVAMSDGTKAKGRYNNTALGGSVEFGRHIKLSDDYFVEPYAQLSSVFIGGDSYTLSNGLKAKNDRTQSVLGKVGTTAARDFTLKDGSVLQPYVRVALAHEFAHDNEVKVNETRFDNSLSGSRLELGAGVAVSLSKRVQLHADFDYMKGEHVEQPWGANVGLKLAF